MYVGFTLSLEDVVVNGINYDQIEITWTDILTREELDECTSQWMRTQNFLTRRMIGLERIGESMLTINPDPVFH